MSSELDHLITRIRSGDQLAFDQFLAENRDRVLRFVMGKMSDALRRKVEAEDILQETFSHCARAFLGMDPSNLDPLAWLYQVAERRTIDAHRHYFGAQKRDAGREVALGAGRSTATSPALIDMLIASFTSPSQAFARGQREQQLLDAMAQLPDDQREALRLRYVADLPTKEIAERIGKSDGAIRVMLTRSLKRLAHLLDETERE